MEQWASEHLDAWLRREYGSRDTAATRELMAAFVDAHPVVISQEKGKSWPEILLLAEREAQRVQS